MAQVIAFMGPDGVGKTTVINELSKRLEASGNKVKVIHFLGSRSKRVTGLNSAVQRTNFEQVRKYIKSIYIYIYGSFFLYYLSLSSYDYVLIDRPTYDAAVSAKRYRANNLYSYIFNAVPITATITIVLYDNPRKVVSRKREMSCSEIKKYYKKLERLNFHRVRFTPISIHKEPSSTVELIEKLILFSFSDSTNAANIYEKTVAFLALNKIGLHPGSTRHKVIKKNISILEINNAGGSYEIHIRKQRTFQRVIVKVFNGPKTGFYKVGLTNLAIKRNQKEIAIKTHLPTSTLLTTAFYSPADFSYLQSELNPGQPLDQPLRSDRIFEALSLLKSKNPESGRHFYLSHGDLRAENCCLEKTKFAIFDWEDWGYRRHGYDLIHLFSVSQFSRVIFSPSRKRVHEMITALFIEVYGTTISRIEIVEIIRTIAQHKRRRGERDWWKFNLLKIRVNYYER